MTEDVDGTRQVAVTLRSTRGGRRRQCNYRSGKTTIGIISKIRQFPLEHRTPMEAMFFLSEIKRQLENMDNKQD